MNMKKYIILMVLILAGLVSFSQNEAQNKTLSYENTYLFYTGTSTDVLTTTDTTWTYTVWKRTDSKINVYVDMLIDSTGGTANNVTIALQNKKFDDLAYVTVASVVWDGINDTDDGEIISFEPSSKSYAFTALSLTDTTGLSGYPADSIATTGTMTITEYDQNNMGMYWRVYILGADNTLLASIRRLNLHFIKP